MLFKTRRSRQERFLAEWAPDLAGLVLDAMPHLRYAGGRTIDGMAGLLLTSPRSAERARFAWPLNVFVCWDDRALDTFFVDPLLAYVTFNAALKSFFIEWQMHGVDLPGGSQQEPRTIKIELSGFAPGSTVAPLHDSHDSVAQPADANASTTVPPHQTPL